MSVVPQPSQESDFEVRRLRTLYELVASLSQANALEDVYAAAIKALFEGTNADRAAILLFDDDGVMRFKSSRGLSAAYQSAVTGHSPWRQGMMDAHPIVIPDSLADATLVEYHRTFQQEGIGALAFIPLTLDHGVIGKFVLYYDQPHECRGGELDISQAIAAHVALVTQHKRAQVALSRSERRLQAILDNSPAVIFVKDAEGRYELVNKRWEDLFHVTKAEVVGRKDTDIFSAEVAEVFMGNDRAVLALGEALTVQEEAPQDDGMHTYVSIKFPLQESDGTGRALCGISTDISKLNEMEVTNQRLAAIVESSADAIISEDAAGNVMSWNRAAERIFGYSAEEAVGQPVAMLAAPDRLDEVPEILSKVFQGQRVEHFETKRRRKDGQVIDVALSVSPVLDATGRIVGASKVARDITDRKLLEVERAGLLAREQEARRTAELLNRVGPRLASQLDAEKLVQEVTDLARALVGAQFGAFFHNVMNEKGETYMLFCISGASRDAFADFPMPRNTAVFGPTFRGEGIVRSDDITKDPRYGKNAPYHGMPEGHLPVRSYLATPVMTRSGEILGGLFFGHELTGQFTETHEAILAGIAAQAAIAMDNARLFEQTQWNQAELKRSNEDLRRANRDLEVFAYSASHDLQEPLRTIAISGQLIERSLGPKLSGHDAEFLSNINTAARSMSSLINDLLTYSQATKYEEGETPGVDAGVILAEVLEGLKGLIQETGVVITAGEFPAVAIHESRLAQLFQNLIGNAIKYRGKEAPRVDITAAKRDGWCVFSISDNGIGIEPEYADRIFGLFKRLHGRDKYPGSGIGLAICQRVVEQYGGRIWLERSEPGKGSTFSFSVPLSG